MLLETIMILLLTVEICYYALLFAVPDTVRHYTAHGTTLHCTTLHYTTLHYTTLHYTSPHYSFLCVNIHCVVMYSLTSCPFFDFLYMFPLFSSLLIFFTYFLYLFPPSSCVCLLLQLRFHLRVLTHQMRTFYAISPHP